MTRMRGATVLSAAVLGLVLSSCGTANRSPGAPSTLAGATTSASQSDDPGALPGEADTDDGGGQTGDQAGDGDQDPGGQVQAGGTSEQSGGPTGGGGLDSTGGTGDGGGHDGDGSPAPSAGPDTNGPAPPAGPDTSSPAPSAGDTSSPAPPAGPDTSSPAPPAGPDTSSPAPKADPDTGRPGGEPGGGSSSAPRPGGAPPDADIIDRLGAFFPFHEFKQAQLAECGDPPDCVDVEIDRERSGADADENWCAYETTPAPAEGGLDEFIQASLPSRAVILVWVVDPGVDEQGEPAACDGSQGPGN
jgi:hypothetical protein